MISRSTIRPPLFRSTNFSYWKFLTEIFIKTEDYELWNIVTKGSCVPMTTIDEKIEEKAKDQRTQADFVKLQKL